MLTTCVFVQARCTQCISADPSPPSGLRWEGSYYYERFLPFGLRSNPAVFDSVATAVNWIMQHEFATDHRLHYLDDFLDVSTGLVAANQQLTIPFRAFTHLGIPLSSIQARRAITIIDLPWYFPRLRAPQSSATRGQAVGDPCKTHGYYQRAQHRPASTRVPPGEARFCCPGHHSWTHIHASTMISVP